MFRRSSITSTARAIGLICSLLQGSVMAAAATGVDQTSQLAETRAETVASASATLRVIEGDILTDSGFSARAIAVDRLSTLWPNGELPYLLDDSLSASAVQVIAEAVRVWNAAGSITLREVEPATAPVDHLVFQTGPGCASWVGRRGGAQEIWIGPNCSAGSVMHEIGHALGLEHEHTRADRDQHVRVIWESVVEEKRHNFETAPPNTRAVGAYDINSIMHYGPTTFSANGAATLVPLGTTDGSRMGQRVAPSRGDIIAIARLYASDLALEIQTDTRDVVRELILHVTNEHVQGAHDIVLELGGLPPGSIVLNAQPWQCAPSGAVLRCTLERLSGSARSQLVVELSEPVSADSLTATLHSKTRDLHPANNGNDTPALGAGSAFIDELHGPYLDGPLWPESTAGGGGSFSGAGAALLLLVLAVRRRRT